MKIDEEVRKELVWNFKDLFRDVKRIFDEYIELLKKAETVEEIMKLKQEFLMNYLELTPLTSEYCYFCLANMESDATLICKNCLYAIHHKKCNEKDSDWSKIHTELAELIKLIEDLYYKGERYYDHIE